ncbi:MAG TPA: helix-turn-helix domain-containing protein [Verrucomicrobiae bacterium]|nr:helix-turn-helix domain-containing protein [Verrucomicrobiae bacterium]
MGELDIGEVAKRSGVTAATLRFYEERRLIRPIGRAGLRRVYSTDVLERLSLIALGQAAGFSLKEVAQIFGSNGRVRIDREALSIKAGELDATIRRLIAMRKGLKHAAACPAPSHLECPTFRRLMRGALDKRGRRPRG